MEGLKGGGGWWVWLVNVDVGGLVLAGVLCC